MVLTSNDLIPVSIATRLDWGRELTGLRQWAALGSPQEEGRLGHKKCFLPEPPLDKLAPVALPTLGRSPNPWN